MPPVTPILVSKSFCCLGLRVRWAKHGTAKSIKQEARIWVVWREAAELLGTRRPVIGTILHRAVRSSNKSGQFICYLNQTTSRVRYRGTNAGLITYQCRRHDVQNLDRK